MSLLLRYRSLLFSLTDLQMAEGADILASDVSNLGAATLAPDQDPMPIDGFALGNLESGFDSFIMPGVIILILQQCIVLAVAMLGGAKHENPGLIGYNPINRGPSVVVDMLAKGACYIVILALPMIWLLHYVPVIFQFPMCGNPVEIFAFVLPMVIASVFLGFVMQAFCSERESIFVIWVATSIIFLFLSGITWPRYAMSPFWSRISDLVPATWGLNGFILMNSNGASLSDVSWIWDKLWILALFYGLIAWAVQRFIVRPATAGK